MSDELVPEIGFSNRNLCYRSPGPITDSKTSTDDIEKACYVNPPVAPIQKTDDLDPTKSHGRLLKFCFCCPRRSALHRWLRVWQCRSPTLHSWGRDRLAQLLGQLLGQLLPQHQHQQQRQQHPTRRSAGLPFMIQALVITELQVKGNPTCLHECMTTLLKLAHASTVPNCTGISTLNQLKSTHYEPNSHDDNNVSDSTETKHAEKSTLKQSKSTHFERNSDADNIVSDKNEQNENTKRTGDGSQAENASICMGSSVETRAHCMNILRALFRNSALEESVAGYVGEGLMVALEGFNKDTWMVKFDTAVRAAVAQWSPG
ncbi:hypothetical protein evm_003525 [Chilo suppressalis]|nr:hypothetical protein evm_003525 [Chilo suppressalis]